MTHRSIGEAKEGCMATHTRQYNIESFPLVHLPIPSLRKDQNNRYYKNMKIWKAKMSGPMAKYCAPTIRVTASRLLLQAKDLHSLTDKNALKGFRQSMNQSNRLNTSRA